MSLLAKAREGRLAALASLENAPRKTNAEILPFDLDFITDQKMPSMAFVSHRTKTQDNLFAA